MSEKYIDVTSGFSFEYMVPCFKSIEEFRDGYLTQPEGTIHNFCKKYTDFQARANTIVQCAKVYIHEHYKKVEDWSQLELKVLCLLNNKITEFYNYDLHKEFYEKNEGDEAISKTFSRFMEGANERAKENHNPIRTVNEISLDPSDGDFYIDINGVSYMPDDKAIISIAGYIEEYKLNNE